MSESWEDQILEAQQEFEQASAAFTDATRKLVHLGLRRGEALIRIEAQQNLKADAAIDDGNLDGAMRPQ